MKFKFVFHRPVVKQQFLLLGLLLIAVVMFFGVAGVVLAVSPRGGGCGGDSDCTPPDMCALASAPGGNGARRCVGNDCPNSSNGNAVCAEYLGQGFTCINRACVPPAPPGQGFSVNLPNPLCLGGENLYFPDGTLRGPNPNCIDTFPEFIAKVTQYILTVIGALAVIMLIWAGFLFVTSAGNPAQIEKAKKAAIYAVIGVAIALAGTGLVEVIKAVLNVS